ncbi:Differentially expressed in FDCP 8, variant 2 [Balamuthia mandrillaris]
MADVSMDNKQELCKHLKVVVAELLAQHATKLGGEQDDSLGTLLNPFCERHDLAQHLCFLLEQVLSHGLNNTAFFGTSCFWSYVQHLESSLPGTGTIVKTAKKLGRSDLGKGRLFLRLALNEGSIHEYLSALLWNTALTTKHYQEASFLRSEYGEEFLKALEQLVPLRFSYKLNDKDLELPNFWSLITLPPLPTRVLQEEGHGDTTASNRGKQEAIQTKAPPVTIAPPVIVVKKTGKTPKQNKIHPPTPTEQPTSTEITILTAPPIARIAEDSVGDPSNGKEESSQPSFKEEQEREEATIIQDIHRTPAAREQQQPQIHTTEHDEQDSKNHEQKQQDENKSVPSFITNTSEKDDDDLSEEIRKRKERLLEIERELASVQSKHTEENNGAKAGPSYQTEKLGNALAQQVEKENKKSDKEDEAEQQERGEEHAGEDQVASETEEEDEAEKGTDLKGNPADGESREATEEAVLCSQHDWLLNELQNCVQAAFADSQSGQFDLEPYHPSTHALCAVIEKILMDGLKGEALFGSIAPWDYLKNLEKCLPGTGHTIQTVSNLEQVTSSRGKGRAFIIHALNECSLRDYLQSLSWDSSLTTNYYQPTALLRNEKQSERLFSLLEPLQSIRFALPLDDASLDKEDAWCLPSSPILHSSPITFSDCPTTPTTLAACIPSPRTPLATPFPRSVSPTETHSLDQRRRTSVKRKVVSIENAHSPTSPESSPSPSPRPSLSANIPALELAELSPPHIPISQESKHEEKTSLSPPATQTTIPSTTLLSQLENLSSGEDAETSRKKDPQDNNPASALEAEHAGTVAKSIPSGLPREISPTRAQVDKPETIEKQSNADPTVSDTPKIQLITQSPVDTATQVVTQLTESAQTATHVAECLEEATTLLSKEINTQPTLQSLPALTPIAKQDYKEAEEEKHIAQVEGIQEGQEERDTLLSEESLRELYDNAHHLSTMVIIQDYDHHLQPKSPQARRTSRASSPRRAATTIGAPWSITHQPVAPVWLASLQPRERKGKDKGLTLSAQRPQRAEGAQHRISASIFSLIVYHKPVAAALGTALAPTITNESCPGCNVSLSTGFFGGGGRFCHYSGKFYCGKCHHNEKSVIPARIFAEWDLKRYKVCVKAKAFIDEHYNKPALNVLTINPKLYAISTLRYLKATLSPRFVLCRTHNCLCF